MTRLAGLHGDQCPGACGGVPPVLATAIDGKGRKQWYYSTRHKTSANKSKFRSMLRFGETLPQIRTHVRRLLADAPAAKFVLFAHHLLVLDAMQEGVLARVPHVRIDGATPAAARPPPGGPLQNHPPPGCTAITLTAAAAAVFLELYWTPALLLQAEDRVHRIGQTAAVTVTYLLGAGTIDELMWPLLQAPPH